MGTPLQKSIVAGILAGPAQNPVSDAQVGIPTKFYITIEASNQEPLSILRTVGVTDPPTESEAVTPPRLEHQRRRPESLPATGPTEAFTGVSFMKD